MLSVLLALIISIQAQQLIPSKKGKLFGYTDPSGNWVIPPQYNFAQPFSSGFAAVELQDKTGYLFINEKGENSFGLIFGKAYPFEGPVARASDPEKGFGLINSSGKWNIIPQGFLNDLKITEGFIAAVDPNGNYGYMDMNGQWVIKPEYSMAGPFSNGMGAVKKDGKWGFVDPSGTLIIPCMFDEIRYFSEDLAAAKKDGKWGYINKTGQWVVQPKYDVAEKFSEGMAVVGYGNYVVNPEVKRGYIDKTGKEVIPIQYYICRNFVNGLAGVCTAPGALYSVLDYTGKTILPPTYNEIFEFDKETGLAMHRHKGKAGYIDRSGKEVIPAKYHAVYGFVNGLCLVTNSSYTMFYIDLKGKEYLYE